MVRWCPSAPLAMKPFEIGQKGREGERAQSNAAKERGMERERKGNRLEKARHGESEV